MRKKLNFNCIVKFPFRDEIYKQKDFTNISSCVDWLNDIYPTRKFSRNIVSDLLNRPQKLKYNDIVLTSNGTD